MFGSGTFNINDSVTAYAKLNYVNDQVQVRGGLAPAITIWQAAIPRYANDSTWLPADLVTLLNSRQNPAAPWALYQSTDYLGPETLVSTTDVWQATAGLKGKLPFRDWTWDIYGSQGDTHTQTDYTGLPSLQRLISIWSRCPTSARVLTSPRPPEHLSAMGKAAPADCRYSSSSRRPQTAFKALRTR